MSQPVTLRVEPQPSRVVVEHASVLLLRSDGRGGIDLCPAPVSESELAEVVREGERLALAWNCHDELVAALSDICLPRLIDAGMEDTACVEVLIPVAQIRAGLAALAKATGEKL